MYPITKRFSEGYMRISRSTCVKDVKLKEKHLHADRPFVTGNLQLCKTTVLIADATLSSDWWATTPTALYTSTHSKNTAHRSQSQPVNYQSSSEYNKYYTGYHASTPCSACTPRHQEKVKQALACFWNLYSKTNAFFLCYIQIQ